MAAIINLPVSGIFSIPITFIFTPKEKKYLYAYQLGFEYKFSPLKKELMQFSAGDRAGDFKYIGKIEVQDD